jgi:hypothetical protein
MSGEFNRALALACAALRGMAADHGGCPDGMDKEYERAAEILSPGAPAIPTWVVEEMSDTMSHEIDYHVAQAHEWCIKVKVLFGVAPHPEQLALVIEDTVTKTYHKDGTVTRQPHEFRFIAHTRAQVDAIDKQLEDLGFKCYAMRQAECAFARALLLLAMQPECKNYEWWQAQPEDDYTPITPSIQGGE